MYLITWNKRYWTGSDWVYIDEIEKAKKYDVWVGAAQDAMKNKNPCKPISCMDVLLSIHNKDEYISQLHTSLDDKEKEIRILNEKIDSLTDVNIDLIKQIKTGVSSSDESMPSEEGEDASAVITL